MMRHVAAGLLLLAALVASAAAQSPKLLNIQSYHNCDCNGKCDISLPPSAGYRPPACYVNASSCPYLYKPKRSAVWTEFNIGIDAQNRTFDYCQSGAAPPKAGNVSTINGCKCLEKYNNAYGMVAENSCIGNEFDRPYCYVDKSSCPDGFTPQKSDFYKGWGWDWCQPKTTAGSITSYFGCKCLKSFMHYGTKVQGTCIPGSRRFVGRLICYVDPTTCTSGEPYPSVTYRNMWFDLCEAGPGNNNKTSAAAVPAPRPSSAPMQAVKASPRPAPRAGASKPASGAAAPAPGRKNATQG